MFLRFGCKFFEQFFGLCDCFIDLFLELQTFERNGFVKIILVVIFQD